MADRSPTRSRRFAKLRPTTICLARSIKAQARDQSGAQAIVWTDVFRKRLLPKHPTKATLRAPSALAGTEGPAAAVIRREAADLRATGDRGSFLRCPNRLARVSASRSATSLSINRTADKPGTVQGQLQSHAPWSANSSRSLAGRRCDNAAIRRCSGRSRFRPSRCNHTGFSGFQ